MVAALGKVALAAFGVADRVRTEAASTVRALQARGTAVYMITGDNRRAAATIAAELGIAADNVFAEVTPAGKASAVQELAASCKRLDGGAVMMVGDGINDAPALANADVGVAVGAGTQVAIEAADVVLVRSDLHAVAVTLDLSRVVFARIRLNFAWAIVYNLVLIPAAAGVFYPFTRMRLPVS